MTIYVATGNAHKVREIDALLHDRDVDVRSAGELGGMPDVVEDADTFAGNAEIKALALAALAPAGTCVLADDSGLVVDALDGRPGIYSARYAGEGASDGDNLRKVLAEMKTVADAQRTARFVCVLALVGVGEDGPGDARFFEGKVEGVLAREPSGTEGFGYDPVFIPDGYAETFGVLGQSVKSTLSHRARAVQALASGLMRGGAGADGADKEKKACSG